MSKNINLLVVYLIVLSGSLLAIMFNDANLKTCVTSTDFTYTHEITTLDCSGRSITNLTGISALTNLVTLKIGTNQIADISSLFLLTSLTHLDLANNPNIPSADINALQIALPGCTISK